MTHGWFPGRSGGASSSVRSKFLRYHVICLSTKKFDEKLNGDGLMTHGWFPDRPSGARTSVRSKFLRYCVICLLTEKFDEESKGDGHFNDGHRGRGVTVTFVKIFTLVLCDMSIK